VRGGEGPLKQLESKNTDYRKREIEREGHSSITTPESNSYGYGQKKVSPADHRSKARAPGKKGQSYFGNVLVPEFGGGEKRNGSFPTNGGVKTLPAGGRGFSGKENRSKVRGREARGELALYLWGRGDV